MVSALNGFGKGIFLKFIGILSLKSFLSPEKWFADFKKIYYNKEIKAGRSMQGRGSEYFLKSLSSNFNRFPLSALHTFAGFCFGGNFLFLKTFLILLDP